MVSSAASKGLGGCPPGLVAHAARGDSRWRFVEGRVEMPAEQGAWAHHGRSQMKNLVPVTVLLISLAGCGGGGGSTSTSQTASVQTPTSSNAFEGAWAGTLRSSSGASVSAIALILASGEMRYVASNGLQAMGTLTAKGSAVSGSGTLYAANGQTFSGGGAAIPVTLSGSGTAGSSFSGTYTSSYDSGTFTFTYNAAALYTTPVVMANVAGAYSSVVTSSGSAISGRLTASGAFTGTDAGGAISGTLTAIDSAKNAFRINATYTPIGQSAQTFSGLAFFNFKYSPVRLEIQMTGASGQLAAELQWTKS